MLLVDFDRVEEREDEDGLPHPLNVSINPNFVGSVIDHVHQRGVSVVRMCDGRGLLVRGTAKDIVAKIRDAVKAFGRKNGKEPLVLPAPTRNATDVDLDHEATNVAEQGSSL